MMGRLAKVAMCLALGAYAAIVASDNIINYTANYAFVQHVLSMDTLPRENPLISRAFAQPSVWRLAYGAIIVSEAIVSLLYIGAAGVLWFHRHSSAARFNGAKGWACAATTAGFAIYFVGFEIVGGEYFAMWQSPQWNGQQPAFRVYMTMLAVLIFVNQPDADRPGPADTDPSG